MIVNKYMEFIYLARLKPPPFITWVKRAGTSLCVVPPALSAQLGRRRSTCLRGACTAFYAKEIIRTSRLDIVLYLEEVPLLYELKQVTWCVTSDDLICFFRLPLKCLFASLSKPKLSIMYWIVGKWTLNASFCSRKVRHQAREPRGQTISL